MWNYSKKVMDHFLHPRNVGELKKPDGYGEVGSMACGDALRLTFKLDKSKRIKEIKFKTFGCASAIASSSALTEMVKGKTVNEAAKITNKDIAKYLNGLPEAKMHCSVMGREALQEAIKNFRGEKKTHKKKVLEGEVVCTCFGITEKEIAKAIKENDLTTVEQVTFHTKAGGGCEKCHPRIDELIKAAQFSATQNNKEKKKLSNLEKVGLVQKVIDETIRPWLKQDGGDLELVDIEGDVVYVKLLGACATCIAAHHTMKQFIEKRLRGEISPSLRVQEVK